MAGYISNSKAAEIYSEAANLIDLGWTQGSYARDKDGNRVLYSNPGAVEWCISGALLKVIKENGISVNTIPGIIDYSNPEWNDDPERTQTDVAKCLRNFARELEAKE